MKGHALQNAKQVVSIAQDASASNAQGGIAIDTRGYEEFLAQLLTGGLTGTLPTMAVKWQEAIEDPANTAIPLSTDWSDIATAAHPTVTVDVASIVASANLTDGMTCTILAQPVSAGRVNIVIVDTTPGIVAGTITVTGTRPQKDSDGRWPSLGALGNYVNADQTVTEVISIAAGAGTYKSTNIFKTITSIKSGVVSGVSGTVAVTVLGGSGDETITVGLDNSGKECPHVGRINLVGRKRFLRAYSTKGGTSPVGPIFAGGVLLAKRDLPVFQINAPDFDVVGF